MRTKKFWFCLIAVLTFTFSQTRAQDAQDDAIKKVISDETNSYFKKDSTAWASTWLMDAKTTRTFVNSAGYFTETGWDKIGPEAMTNFRNNPKPDTIELAADSFMIRKEGKVAVVDYQQVLKLKANLAPFDKFISREHRVLIKKDGKWKIASQITNDITGYGIDGVELAINGAGYAYLQAGKNDQAIQVLELNTKLFPNSFNVFDSLGEAYAAAGNKELAIKNYEKSIQLNPNSTSGKKALEKLK